MSRNCPQNAVFIEKLLICARRHGIILHMQRFHVTVVRSRRRTLSLSVNGNGEVVVRAPERMRDAQIEAFVHAHRDWIERRLAALERVRPDLSDGAPIAVCGTVYTIATGERARIAGGRLFLPEQGREGEMAALLRRMARVRMSALVKEYAARYGFSYGAVRITSARGRWGSCSSSGTLSFSFRTALLTDGQARYIAVHELCHTRHMNHSAAFWREVGRILPDYAKARRELRKMIDLMLFF